MSILNLLKIDEFTTSFYERIDLDRYVLFVENSNQTEVVKYIKSNYNSIQEAFKLQGKQFILFSEITNTPEVLRLLKYCYPRLNKDDVLLNLNFDIIKRYLGYKGNISTGLLSIDTTLISQFIEFESNNVTDFIKLTEDFLINYRERWYSYISDNDFDDMLLGENYSTDDDIKLDDETKKAVDLILEQFQTLKDKGNLLQVLPIVENYLKVQNTVSFNDLSPLKVDGDFSIYLTDYNLEIKLSHLTKSIYLLFLNHPEGILLSKLEPYKSELLQYYKNVSNRDDLDKMRLSIDDVVNTKTNAIYVHLSRIKSVITKQVHPSIAEYYIIDGGKNQPKKIMVGKNLVLWNNKLSAQGKVQKFDDDTFFDD